MHSDIGYAINLLLLDMFILLSATHIVVIWGYLRFLKRLPGGNLLMLAAALSMTFAAYISLCAPTSQIPMSVIAGYLCGTGLQVGGVIGICRQTNWQAGISLLLRHRLKNHPTTRL